MNRQSQKFFLITILIIGITLILANCKFTKNNLQKNRQINISSQIPPIGENQKYSQKYSQKEVFIISDQNWQDVLSFVPVATWTDKTNKINQYPFLVFHQEKDNFDIDSIISFINQYQSEKITIVGETPVNFKTTLEKNISGKSQINQINAGEIFSFWQAFENVIYSEDNYEVALLASTYASLVNAPLIIQNHPFDNKKILAGRNTICVGETKKQNCFQKYSLEQMRQKYLELTKTDKIILVNPDDLNIKIKEKFQPKLTKGKINELYSKTSLMAPILASARQELILSVRSQDYKKVDQFIEKEIGKIGHDINYLTIIASPKAIPFGDLIKPGKEKYYASLDTWVYANIDDEPFMDLAVGRIMGITSSDISAYIARSLFYPQTETKKEVLVISDLDDAEEFIYSKVFNLLGYKTTLKKTSSNPKDLENKDILLYNIHGDPDWAGDLYSWQIPSLSNSLTVILACSTCGFDKISSKANLFCARAMRQGAIAYIGALDEWGDVPGWTLFSRLYAYDDTLGKAHQRATNTYLHFQSNHYNSETFTLGSYSFVLIGDPLIRFNKLAPLPKSSISLSLSNNKIESHTEIMSVSLKNDPFGRGQFTLSTTEQYLDHLYLRAGPFDLNYKKPTNLTSSKWQEVDFTPLVEIEGDKKYFWIQQKLLKEDLLPDQFTAVEDTVEFLE